MQAIWYEGLVNASLTTTSGETVTILYPGEWNHGPGPDFLHAALVDGAGRLRHGTIEFHLDAAGWASHGHADDPAYEKLILHVVWSKSPGSRSSGPPSVPEVVLCDQTIAPWPILAPHIALLGSSGQAEAVPGLCRGQLEKLSGDAALGVLHEAGMMRLRRRGEHLTWRARAVGFRQMLWEALSEALGYRPNKEPCRDLARRLTAADLEKRSPAERTALLFGLAGFLPEVDVSILSEPARDWVRPQWDFWWRVRAEYHHVWMSRDRWTFAAIRPWNRPERRVAAMAGLVARLPRLEVAIEKADATDFAETLGTVGDAFWDERATLAGKPLSRRVSLIGPQRINDMLINVFWPLAARHDENAAREALRKLRPEISRSTRVAAVRIAPGLKPKRVLGEALTQQGLLEIYRSFCLDENHAGCLGCPFPDQLNQLVEG